MADIPKNTVAILLILALVFAGVGVGIAINNYTSVSGQFTDVPTAVPAIDKEGAEVIVNIVPAGKGDEGG